MSKDLTNLNIQIETSLNKLHQRETGMNISTKKEEGTSQTYRKSFSDTMNSLDKIWR